MDAHFTFCSAYAYAYDRNQVMSRAVPKLRADLVARAVGEIQDILDEGRWTRRGPQQGRWEGGTGGQPGPAVTLDKMGKIGNTQLYLQKYRYKT